MNSALFSYLSPNLFPIFTPITDKINVIIPIDITGNTIFILRQANVIQTAKASMLVAIANITIVLMSILSLQFSEFLLKDSFIMLLPIAPNNANAIQWS